MAISLMFFGVVVCVGGVVATMLHKVANVQALSVRLMFSIRDDDTL